MIKLDDLLQDIGEFGAYQKRVFALVCTIVFTSSWVSMIIVFLGASTDHWCAIPQLDDLDCNTAEHFSSAECQLAKNLTIPSNFTEEDGMVFEQCVKYNMTSAELWSRMNSSSGNQGADQSTVVPCDDGWAYDRSQYKSSIVTDYDLVCGTEDLKQISQSVFYGGFLAGSIINGSLADIVGRWWTLLACMIIRVITGVGIAFAPNWWVFTVLRFFQGYAGISIYILTFILGTEFVGPSKRNITGILFAVPFAVGYMLLALIAYFVRYWRTLELIATIPALLYVVLVFFLPESVRWQISTKKYDRAEKALLKIAETNKKHLSTPVFSREYKKAQEAEGSKRSPTAFDLFRTPRMRLRTINLIFNWMVNVMVYHGLSLNSSNLGVDDYVAFAVSGGVEIPAYLISVVIIELIGRRLSLLGCLLLGGIACLCTTFVPSGIALTTVAMIGKFGISASFAILYLYTVELYPTSIRTTAMGTCSMFSRIAGIIAPLILTLSKIWTPLPLVIYGSVAVIAGLLTLLLPETKGRRMPETLEEGENFGRNSFEKDGEPQDNGAQGKGGVYVLKAGGHLVEDDKEGKCKDVSDVNLVYDNPTYHSEKKEDDK